MQKHRLLDALKDFAQKLEAYGTAYIGKTISEGEKYLSRKRADLAMIDPQATGLTRLKGQVTAQLTAQQVETAFRTFTREQPALSQEWGHIKALARDEEMVISADADSQIAEAILPTKPTDDPLARLRLIERAWRVVLPVLIGQAAAPPGGNRTLVKSILVRSALLFVIFAELECVIGLCAWCWGEGENLWVKIIKSWPLFGAVFVGSAITYRFILGRERWRLLKFWKGDDK